MEQRNGDADAGMCGMCLAIRAELENKVLRYTEPRRNTRAARDLYLSSIYQAVNFVNRNEPFSHSVEVLRSYLDRLEDVWVKYENETTELLSQVPATEVDRETQYFLQTQESFIFARAAMRYRIRDLERVEELATRERFDRGRYRAGPPPRER